MNIEFFPVISERWDDFETLFGGKGGTGGCWCMYWRLPNKEHEANQGEGNRQKMQGIVASGEVPGILAYLDGQPVGWCSVAPRERFPRLRSSRVFKSHDNQPVWTIVCLFINKDFRRQQIATRLVQAAVDYARENGAQIVEACPIDTEDAMPDAFAWTGIASSFRQVGFVEVARRSESRPLMRYYLK
jgi:GNAT superfamily N-acetyltransferase